jgi:hypothetical protein
MSRKRHGAVGLRIEIDEQRRLAAQGERSGKIDGRRRLTDAPFLIGDCYDHGWRRAPAGPGRHHNRRTV